MRPGTPTEPRPMPDLTNKQKRALRAAGRNLPALGAVGKAGLTGGVIAAIDRLLETHELVKVRLGPLAAGERGRMSRRLAQATGAVCLAAVGRTVLLYRPEPSGKRTAPDADQAVSR